MKNERQRENDTSSLFPVPWVWIRIFSWTSGLIGLFGILLLMSQGASAQPQGFQGGKKPFTNPFANPGGGAPPKVQAPSRGGIKLPGTGRGDKDVPDPKKSARGIEIGGEPPGGVIPNEKLSALYVNSETGSGSKELITDFNYPDADILDIAKTIGKLTGKNFIFDKNVKGRISIVSNSPITVADAWRAFLTSLDINGYTLIPSGKYIRIARQRDARDKQLNTYTGDFSPKTDALITRVFPLKHISADEVARTFRSFMPANSRIIPYNQTNTVIVTDTGSNIAKLAKMLEFLDIEGYDLGIEVVPVKFASAVEIAKLIDALLPGTQTGGSKSKRRSRVFGRGGNFSARRTKEGGIINTIIADERTNSLIVHSNPKGKEQVQELVAKLDKKLPAPVGGGKIHVVYLQFADAEEVAKTLNNLSQQTRSSSRRSNRRRSGGRSGSTTGNNPLKTASASLFEGSIRVSADKATNSLVVTASQADFVTVQRVINKLDIPRDEVFVEVVIMEIEVDKTSEFSVNVASPKSGLFITPKNDLLEFVQNPLAQSGLVIPFKAGEESDFNVGGQTFKVSSILGLIKAIQSKTNSNILATPQILTLDNTEATFETAENIPVPTSNQTQTGFTTSFTKEKVALSITIKPQINKLSNFVKLDIKAKLEDVSIKNVPSALASQAFGTFERRAETSIVVADTDTIVLGGLMRDRVSDNVSKIPILGDIPLLGWLFRSKSRQVRKTNLMMFITPQIIRQYEKVRAVLDKKLKQRDEFIEKAAGGRDPYREYRDEMIRALPDPKDLLQTRPDKGFNLTNDNPAAKAVKESGSPFTGDSNLE